MTATMVFVHGRGQEFKDPVKMLVTWRRGLATGLERAGLAVEEICSAGPAGASSPGRRPGRPWSGSPSTAASTAR